jgi:CheY-like chemotaxis protein
MAPPLPLVLIVEDDEDIRDSLADFLVDHGYRTAGAVNGRDALDRLGAAAALPCAIILDLMMPIMDGRTFREMQLQTPALAKIPVILVTAHHETSQSWIDPTLADRLPKPLNLMALLETLQRICSGAARSPGLSPA